MFVKYWVFLKQSRVIGSLLLIGDVWWFNYNAILNTHFIEFKLKKVPKYLVNLANLFNLSHTLNLITRIKPICHPISSV